MTPTTSQPNDRTDQLQQWLERLDAQESRVRRRAVFFTALPVVATIVCLVLIAVVVSGSLRQAADAERRQARAIEATAQAEAAREAAEGRTAIAVQELENIGRRIEERQKALEALGQPGQPSRIVGNPAATSLLNSAAADSARTVKEIESVTSELSARPPAAGAEPPSRSTRSDLIQQLYSPQAATRVRAYNTLMAEHARDPRLVPELLEVGKRELQRKPLNANGIFNTLVVLSHVNRLRLQPHREEIRRFADEAKAVGGPSIGARADTLIERLP